MSLQTGHWTQETRLLFLALPLPCCVTLGRTTMTRSEHGERNPQEERWGRDDRTDSRLWQTLPRVFVSSYRTLRTCPQLQGRWISRRNEVEVSQEKCTVKPSQLVMTGGVFRPRYIANLNPIQLSNGPKSVSSKGCLVVHTGLDWWP
ncbi:unnamed protein product [Eretmochelys imbricata]